MGLQAIVDDELDAAVTKYNPTSAVVIVTRPTTGEILALANRPDFDPNHSKDAEENQQVSKQ